MTAIERIYKLLVDLEVGEDSDFTDLFAIESELAALKAERDRFKAACIKQEFSISQTLGRALGYVEADGSVNSAAHTAETLAREAARELAVRDSLLKELVESSHDVIKHAVILLEEYLSAFDKWPDTATIQGWEKSRWKLALKAKKRLDLALAQARKEMGREIT